MLDASVCILTVAASGTAFEHAHRPLRGAGIKGSAGERGAQTTAQRALCTTGTGHHPERSPTRPRRFTGDNAQTG